MPVVGVRVAGREDIDSLCDLYAGFHEFHAEGVPSRLASLADLWPVERAALASRLRELISVSEAAVFVAEQDGEVLGFAEVYVRDDESTPARVARRHGHLQSMFVVSSCRNRGIGGKLLASCEAWARSQGAEEMRLDIWEFPDGPLGFYERQGYRTVRRNLARELD